MPFANHRCLSPRSVPAALAVIAGTLLAVVLLVMPAGARAAGTRAARAHAAATRVAGAHAAATRVAGAHAAATRVAGAHAAATAYQNPFSGEEPYVGRTDMGVDVCLSPGDPIRAVGDGIVAGIMRKWAGRQPYLWYELTGGDDAGRYVYVAEQITNLAHVGQTLRAGDVVASYARKGTCIETGWSTATGATLAQATTGYTEGEVTVAGVSFARFLISLGVQGTFDLVPAHTTRATSTKKHRGRRRPGARVS